MTGHKTNRHAGSAIKTILITGARVPVAVHLARLLHRADFRVLMCDHLNAPLGAASKVIDGYYKIASFRLEASAAEDQLRALISKQSVDYIIPTCEEVFYLAQISARGHLEAEVLAPDIALLEHVHNKYRFIKLLNEIGLPAPETHLLKSVTDRDAFTDVMQEYVFKPVWSRFASDAVIRPKHKKFCKVMPSSQRPWVAQRFIHGKEISVYATAFDGKLNCLSAYRSTIRAGLGAGVCFEQFVNDDVRSFVDSFVAKTNWTGQISFDVIIQDNGVVMPLECNPRATSGLHFINDAAAFSEALLGRTQMPMTSVNSILGVRLAIWLYGISGLLKRQGVARLWHALRYSEDVLNVAFDPIGLWPQVKSIVEFAMVAIKTGQSLQQASTYDIEWNGEDHNSISN